MVSVHAPVLSATCQPPLDPVHGRHVSRSAVPVHPSKDLGRSRKIRWSVPTDKKRVRAPRARRTRERGHFHRWVKLGEASKAPTFSRIRPKGCTALRPRSFSPGERWMEPLLGFLRRGVFLALIDCWMNRLSDLRNRGWGN